MILRLHLPSHRRTPEHQNPDRHLRTKPREIEPPCTSEKEQIISSRRAPVQELSLKIAFSDLFLPHNNSATCRIFSGEGTTFLVEEMATATKVTNRAMDSHSVLHNHLPDRLNSHHKGCPSDLRGHARVKIRPSSCNRQNRQIRPTFTPIWLRCPPETYLRATRTYSSSSTGGMSFQHAL